MKIKSRAKVSKFDWYRYNGYDQLSEFRISKFESRMGFLSFSRKWRVSFFKQSFWRKILDLRIMLFHQQFMLTRRKCTWTSVIVKVVKSVLHPRTIFIFFYLKKTLIDCYINLQSSRMWSYFSQYIILLFLS